MIPTHLRSSQPMNRRQTWPTVVALALLWTLTLAGQLWVWPVIFLVIALLEIAAGESTFVQRLTRSDHPILYWCVVGSWVTMSAWWLTETL